MRYYLQFSVILKRDGTNVVVDKDCKPTSVTWDDPYTGRTYTNPSELDIVSPSKFDPLLSFAYVVCVTTGPYCFFEGSMGLRCKRMDRCST